MRKKEPVACTEFTMTVQGSRHSQHEKLHSSTCTPDTGQVAA